MAPKDKNKGRDRRSTTPVQTSASDPNPTAVDLFLPLLSHQRHHHRGIPCSILRLPTTQLLPWTPPQPTTILQSSASQITTTQPRPSSPPLPVQETHQERIPCTSGAGSTATDLPGPSTAPSASTARTRTPTLLPITDEFMSLFFPAVAGAMAALQSVNTEDAAEWQEMVVSSFGFKLDEMESVIGSLQALADRMKGDAELKAATEALFNLEVLRSAVEVTEKLLVERRKRHESGGSCSGSKGGGGGPDSGSGSGEGDGEGGGVSV